MMQQNTERNLSRQDILRSITSINMIGELDHDWEDKLADAINEVRKVESDATDGEKERMYRRIYCFLEELRILHEALAKHII